MNVLRYWKADGKKKSLLSGSLHKRSVPEDPERRTGRWLKCFKSGRTRDILRASGTRRAGRCRRGPPEAFRSDRPCFGANEKGGRYQRVRKRKTPSAENSLPRGTLPIVVSLPASLLSRRYFSFSVRPRARAASVSCFYSGQFRNLRDAYFLVNAGTF